MKTTFKRSEIKFPSHLNILESDNHNGDVNSPNEYVIPPFKSNILKDLNVNSLPFIPDREIPSNCYVFNSNGSVSNNSAIPLKLF